MEDSTLEWLGDLFIECFAYVAFSFLGIFAYNVYSYIWADVQAVQRAEDRRDFYNDCLKLHPQRPAISCVNEAFTRYPTADEIRLNIKETHTEKEFQIEYVGL